ncbi:MAG: uracil-DNA glycosylase [Hyphomicrobiales bacterium]|nr:uracil-DNA glycosylase [Hyphomicrobiales bacterium]
MGAYAEALDAFRADPASAGWRDLPFFTDGEAGRVTGHLDHLAGAGAVILPKPADVFAALAQARLAQVKVVILGQDPYPTPGHAHGLAFSKAGDGPLPASLKRIFRELADDLGIAAPASGDLSGWAAEGVLLLNAALTTEAGKAGHHLRLGWQSLTDQAIVAVSAGARAAAFILWGDKARARRGLIDARHLVIESAHPSPLAARGDFLGSRPFSRTNAFLAANGVGPVDWLADLAMPGSQQS